jgi:hypothetical protein
MRPPRSSHLRAGAVQSGASLLPGDPQSARSWIHWVQIDLDEAAEDIDHLISPEERLRVAMARQ